MSTRSTGRRKRPRKPHGPARTRRLQLESLEQRAMLDGTPLVEIELQLAAVTSPSAGDIAALPPESVAAVHYGDAYYVEAWLHGTDAEGSGIIGGRLDLLYETDLADVVSVDQGGVYTELDLSTIDDPHGRVDNLGGGTFTDGQGVDDWVRLGYVEVTATDAGHNTFSLQSGSLQLAHALGEGNVDWQAVDLTDAVTVVHDGLVDLDMSVVVQPTMTEANGEVDTLPAGDAYVHEWQPYWVEIWLSTRALTTDGIVGGVIDVHYDTALATATQIEYGPAFTGNQTGTIDDGAGLIDDLGATTALLDAGDDRPVLFARVQFEPTAGDQAAVDEAGHSIGPYDLGLSASDMAIGLTRVGAATTVPSDPPATPLWAVVYDIDDNDQIDFGDFSYFAGAFNLPVDPAEPPWTWWADFDKTAAEFVDFGDFAFFAQNFGKAKGDGQAIVVPANYPVAWTDLVAPQDPPPPAGDETPEAFDDQYTVIEDQLLAVGAGDGVMANDTGELPLIAHLVTDPSHGTVTLSDDGSFSYDSAQNFHGVDTFTYKASTPDLTETVVTGLNNAISVVIDETAGKLYFTESDYIRVSNLDGSDVQDVFADGHISYREYRGLALDLVNGKIYWLEKNRSDTDTIRRANLDGTGVEDLVTGLDVRSNLSLALDVDGGKMYWAYGRGADYYRANLDGSEIEGVSVTGMSAVGIALDLTARKVYLLSSSYPYRIVRADLDGTNPESLVTLPGEPTSIVLDPADDRMYWTTLPSTSAYLSIWRARLDGQGVEEVERVLAPSLPLAALALDFVSRKVYLTNDFTILKTNMDPPTDSNIATVSITVNAVNDAPVAGDDVYQVNQDNRLVVAAVVGVLDNDTDIEGDPLTAVVDTLPTHGILDLADDGSFVYTPDAGYTGPDSFTYHAADGTDDSNVATVDLTVNELLIDVALTAVAAPTASDTAAALPGSIDTVDAGDVYYVAVWVQDKGDPGVGVLAGRIDVGYTTALADATDLDHGGIFTALTSGTIDEPAGLIDNFGGGSFAPAQGIEPNWVRMGYVRLVAEEPGEARFQLAQGDLQFSRFDGQGNIDWSLVDTSDLLLVDHRPASVIEMTTVEVPTTTEANGEVDTLPQSLASIDEWDDCWVELWVHTPSHIAEGIESAVTDLVYDTNYYTAEEIEYGPAFSDSRTGTIDDATGLVDGLGAATAATDVGDDRPALLARVHFRPTAADQVPVDEATPFSGPYDLGLGLVEVAIVLDGGTPSIDQIVPVPQTQLFANPYDVNDDDVVDETDFAVFEAAFDHSVGTAEPPYVAWADFDGSGLVDFNDFGLFATRYHQSKSAMGLLSLPDDGPYHAPAGSSVVQPADSADPPQTYYAPAGFTVSGDQTVAVRVAMVALADASSADTAAELPTSLADVSVGENFVLEVWVQDDSGSASGVTGGHVDIAYSTGQIDPAGALDNGDIYTLFTSGTLNDATGLIDDLGGATLDGGVAAAPGWARLGYVEMAVSDPGPVAFELSPGAFSFGLFDAGNVAWDEVAFENLTLNLGQTADDDAYACCRNVTLGVPQAEGVLANDENPDLNLLQAVLVDDVDHGTLALQADGSFTYTPDADFVGTDAFSYAVSNGDSQSSAAVVEISVLLIDVEIIDNGDPGFWTSEELPGDPPHWNDLPGAGFDGDSQYSWTDLELTWASWTFEGIEAGDYWVSVTWPGLTNGAVDAPFEVYDGPTWIDTVLVDQSQSPGEFPDEGSWWDDLGLFTITGNTLTVALYNDAGPDAVVADAVRIERVADPIPFDPSPMEQEMLEHVNRMRINPAGELDVFFSDLDTLTSYDQDVTDAIEQFNDPSSAELQSDWAALVAAPPLAWSASLQAAALGHNLQMIAEDDQQHNLPGELELGDRVTEAGYTLWSNLGENIYAYAESMFHGHAGFAVDWDVPDRGHRTNLMNPGYREAGISVTPEGDSGTEVGPLVVTEDFGNRYRFGNPFVLGVVYEDVNGNGRYDAGEGYGGVDVELAGPGGTFTTTTMTAGGYQLQVPAGTYTMTVSGGDVSYPLSPAGIVVDTDNVKVDFIDPPEVVLLDASAGFLELSGQDPSTGDLWYRFETTRAGLLTLDAVSAGSGQSVALTLYDQSHQNPPLAESDLVDGRQRIDRIVAGPGEVYYARLSGTSSDVTFRLANLVHQAGDTLTVFGTDDVDAFELDTATSPRMRINGIGYEFTGAEAAVIHFDGAGGDDTAALAGSTAVETARLRPGWGTLSRPGLDVSLANTPYIAVDGGDGNDVAFLYDSPGDDTLVVDDTHGTLTGGLPDDPFGLTVNSFRYVHGYSTAGGTDTAELHGTAGRETVVTRSTDAKIIGAGHFGRAWYFGEVTADGGDGIDVAFLHDSPGDDTLVVNDTYSTLTGGLPGKTFAVRVDNFRYVHGYSTAGGTDTANLHGTTGRETVVARPTNAKIIGSEHFGRAWYFDEVTAEGGGGIDVAFLYDSPGDDTLEIDDKHGSLAGGLPGDPFEITVNNFRYVHGYATAGGADTAKLHGTAGQETVVARPTNAKIIGSEHFGRAWYFDEVTMHGGGGIDVAFLYDSPGDDTLEIDNTHGSLAGGLPGDPFEITVNNFRYVHGYATAGGTDTAKLYGTAGKETVVTRPTYVKIIGAGYFGRAWYFDHVFVEDGGGDDDGVVYDADHLESGFRPLPPSGLGKYYWLWELEHYTVVNQSGTTHFDAVDAVYTAYWD